MPNRQGLAPTEGRRAPEVGLLVFALRVDRAVDIVLEVLSQAEEEAIACAPSAAEASQ